jgi:hypothetical protein
LLSIRAKGAWKWLSTRLDIASRRMVDFEFCDSFRFRFGMDPVADLPEECACGYNLEDYAWHAIDCKKMAKFRTRLHNSLLHSARSWFNLLCASTDIEPKEWHVGALLEDGKEKKDERKLRWDTSSTLVSGRVLSSDFTVLDSLAPSHLAKASSESLAVADAAARAKVAKYNDLAVKRRVKFFPCAFEMTGGIHRDVSAFIKEAVQESGENVNWAPRELVFGVKADWAVAVQRLRARLVQAWLRFNC